MALSLVRGAVVPPFQRFAEAPAGFPGTLGTSFLTPGTCLQTYRTEHTGICVSHTAVQRLVAQHAKVYHEVFGSHTLYVVFCSATVTVFYLEVTL